MTEGRGLLRSILDSLEIGKKHPYPELDLVLMVVLADGPPTSTKLDALDILTARFAWEDVDWSVVQTRIETLLEDAPLFSDTRTRLRDAYVEDRTQLLRLAASIAGMDGKLSEDVRTILGFLSEDFHLPELRTQDLGLTEDPQLRYARSRFNHPQTTSLSFEAALVEAPSDAVLRVLVFKLIAIRNLMSRLDDGAKRPPHVLGLGRRLAHNFVADAFIDTTEERWVVRCLAKGEALHHQEREVIKLLLESLERGHRFVLAHEAPLSPADRYLVESLDPARVKTILLTLD